MPREMKQPKGLLLDFYGTLVEEDEGPILDVCRNIARSSPKDVSWEQIAEEWAEMFHRLCYESFGENFQLEREIETRTVEILVEKYEGGLDSGDLVDGLYRHWEHPAIFPETREALAKIRMPLCVVSNVDNDALEAALEFSGLSFDMIVTSEDCRSYKPRPETFEKALGMLGMKNTEVLHVGDSLYTDVRGAKSLGISAVWIDNRGKKPTAGDTRPDFVAKDLNGLLKILDNLEDEA